MKFRVIVGDLLRRISDPMHPTFLISDYYFPSLRNKIPCKAERLDAKASTKSSDYGFVAKF